MTTLALETASSHGSLALLDGTRLLAATALEARLYAATLLPAMQALLMAHGLTLGDIELLAAADGPGSFTGVRIGLATVKAMMESRGIRAVAVSTLAAVAASASVPAGTPALAALDAGRGEVYSGIFASGALQAEGGEVIEPVAAFAARLQAWAGAGATPDAGLAVQCARLQQVDALLAPAVGRLAQAPGSQAADALTLDARYLGARWK